MSIPTEPVLRIDDLNVSFPDRGFRAPRNRAVLRTPKPSLLWLGALARAGELP